MNPRFAPSAPGIAPTLSHPTCIIEFFGLPGAGKSSLADVAGQKYNLKTRSQLLTDWGALSAFGKARHLLPLIRDREYGRLSVDFARRAPLRTLDGLRRLALVVAKHPWIASQTGSILLDEGFLQSLWSALYSARAFDVKPAVLERLLARLYRGTEAHIVFVDVDIPTAAQRIKMRNHGRSRFDTLELPEIQTRLRGSERIVERLVAAASNCGMHVHRLDGRIARDRLEAETADLVGTLIRRRSAARGGHLHHSNAGS